MPLDYENLIKWPFQPFTRHYDEQNLIEFAQGFGAGIDENWIEADNCYLKPGPLFQALPMAAVALTDGPFWEQDGATGIDWRQMVHAQESLYIHRPLPRMGGVTVSQRVADIFDKGAEKGAEMLQTLELSDLQGELLARVEVTTVLRGNGGFGGQPSNRPRLPAIPDREPDATQDIRTPVDPDTPFRLKADIALTRETNGIMIRGLGSFGLAGRGVLWLTCANRPERLRMIAVRYAGPMFTAETMRLELWHTAPNQAVFRLQAVERQQPVISSGVAEFDPDVAD
ncbi:MULTISPECIES: MaoC/PaaZ C-terminal domain-containing protein [unclassified Pseudomonas]|uniref:MaoC/PaaZ C-terminal domain-containing protein n=1 Tax=unclassified Pseudomonas TaxID=196821 RepID=UPI0025E84C3C|nr:MULTISPECIES: MaoC/PaaZ C-terminal domain-containing protein [unclassified Pseudomonas]